MKLGRFAFGIAAALLVLVVPCKSQNLSQNFHGLLKKHSMQFALPPGFEVTPVVDNGDVVYDYAVRSKTKHLEIRYRIWPIDENPCDFEAMAITMGLNISDGNIMQTKHYPRQDVKAEFGADDGLAGMVRVDSDFGKGYKVCSISVIHKDNVADAYVFFLADDPKTLLSAFFDEKAYHALRFR